MITENKSRLDHHGLGLVSLMAALMIQVPESSEIRAADDAIILNVRCLGAA
jgi:hypothetical protein